MLVMIMAGGTGGHVYPALAVAQNLLAAGESVVWLGTQKGIEAQVVPDANIKLETISVSGLRGNGLRSWLKAPFKLLVAVWQVRKIIKQYQPSAVLGMGGFVTGPGGVAAYLSGVPLLIHDQNAIAGLTNKLLKPLAKKVLQAFPGTFKEAANVITVGNPVRADIEAVPVMTETHLPLQVLILGGSLGAQALNEVLPKALKLLETSITVWHQTGKGKLKSTELGYQEQGLAVSVEGILPESGFNLSEFISDMPAAFTWADVVICRAGAMTVFELAAAGKPALLVPYPYAVDLHQHANAQYLVQAGAAIMVDQKDLSPAGLSTQLKSWSEQPHQLLEMAKKAQAKHQPKASEMTAQMCLEYK